MSMTQNSKKIILIGYILLHLTVCLSQGSCTSLFQHVKNAVQQFYYKWNESHAILLLTQISTFGRTKFDTHTVTWQSPDLFVYTSSSVAFFLMQWDKEQLCFQPNLAFHLRVATNFFNDHFFVTWVHKEFANLHVVEFNRKSQNTWTPQNLFMT